MTNIIQFNPLDQRNLGAAVAEALLVSAPISLAQLTQFKGAGIYAIYYAGPFPAYREIAVRNQGGQCSAPIYVGKAVSKGGRRGGALEAVTGSVLYSRLREHADSIRAASNLDIQDFYCQALVVDEIWIPLGESLLITRFMPLWNRMIDGFGNHDPGSGRHAGMRPRWDVLHPGRAWADKLAHRQETAVDIARDAEQYLRTAPLAP